MGLKRWHRTFYFLLIYLLTSAAAGFFDNLFGNSEDRDDSEGSSHKSSETWTCEEVRVLPRVANAIIGGARINEQKTIPYMVALGESSKNSSIFWFCGGSLISKNIVLTAAHCISNRDADYVRLGATRLDNEISSDDFRVSWTKIHPEYKIPETYNDLAVVKLSSDVHISAKVKPICLAKDVAGRTPGEYASVAGWGAQTVGGQGTRDLRQVKVRIFANNECDRVYSNNSVRRRQFPRGITDGQLCAGSPEGGKDSCQGDSGGPLVAEDSDGVVRLLGVVSSGADCGLKAFPGVYVRTSAYHSWIRQFL